jgi:hypothetical protein
VRLSALAFAAMTGTLFYTPHYDQQLRKRPTPTRSDITFMLCDDSPMIIEENSDHGKGPICLIWAQRADGCIGHLVCRNDSSNVVVTAYFPEDTNPEKWDDDYITRKDYNR